MKIQDRKKHHDTPAVAAVKKRPLIVRLLPVWILGGSLVATVVMVSALKKPPESQPKPDTARLVETITVTPDSLHFDVETYGTVMPRTETNMVAEVSGQVVKVAEAFAAGGFLQAGDLLMQIDPSDYETALLSAEANLASAKASLSQEQAQSEQARKDWERLNPNREPNALVLRLPQLDGAKAAVRSAEADVLKARRDLERTYIRMPYDGLVKARAVDLGQYVTPGASVGEVFAVAVAEIRLPLTNDDLAFVDLPSVNDNGNSKPAVTLSAQVGHDEVHWQGQIVRTEGVVDSNSRVIYAVAEVNDPYGLLGSERIEPLKVGTFVSASITGRLAQNVVTVPRSILQPNNQLLIANNDNKLEIRDVEVLRATPETAYVGSGLAAGEKVIITNIAAPIPGIALRTEAPSIETLSSEAETSVASAADGSGQSQSNQISSGDSVAGVSQ
jgi:RND family efflux transporter MFP subunit